MSTVRRVTRNRRFHVRIPGLHDVVSPNARIATALRECAIRQRDSGCAEDNRGGESNLAKHCRISLVGFPAHYLRIGPSLGRLGLTKCELLHTNAKNCA